MKYVSSDYSPFVYVDYRTYFQESCNLVFLFPVSFYCGCVITVFIVAFRDVLFLHCREQTILNWEDDYCSQLPSVKPVTYIQHAPTDCRAFVAVDTELCAIVVAFCGSATLKNFQVRLQYR